MSARSRITALERTLQGIRGIGRDPKEDPFAYLEDLTTDELRQIAGYPYYDDDPTFTRFMELIRSGPPSDEWSPGDAAAVSDDRSQQAPDVVNAETILARARVAMTRRQSADTELRSEEVPNAVPKGR